MSGKGGERLESLEPHVTPEDMAALRDVERQATLVFAEPAEEPNDIGIIHNDFILGNC